MCVLLQAGTVGKLDRIGRMLGSGLEIQFDE
jgi:hypothetical protein